MRGSNGKNEVGGRGRLQSQKFPSYQNALEGIICLFFLLRFIQRPLHMPASIGMIDLTSPPWCLHRINGANHNTLTFPKMCYQH